jgi:hypothetical protein
MSTWAYRLIAMDLTLVFATQFLEIQYRFSALLSIGYW